MFISRVILFAFKNWKIASRYGMLQVCFLIIWRCVQLALQITRRTSHVPNFTCTELNVNADSLFSIFFSASFVEIRDESFSCLKNKRFENLYTAFAASQLESGYILLPGLVKIKRIFVTGRNKNVSGRAVNEDKYCFYA